MKMNQTGTGGMIPSIPSPVIRGRVRVGASNALIAARVRS